LLKLAKLDAASQPAPGPLEIDKRNRERIMADPSLTQAPGDDEADFVRELLAAYTPEQIAAAFLRQQIAARPAAEELSEGGVPVFDPSKGERPDARFENGVWFTISLGRRHRAEPRWLLPLICKSGNVTKREIGSIRILETESRFEIVADKADGFAEAVRQGTGEKGVVIQRVKGGGKAAEPARPWKKKQHRKGQSAHAPKPPYDRATAGRPKKKFKPKKRLTKP
jgi:ATP-dependent RNA helicase DeaD